MNDSQFETIQDDNFNTQKRSNKFFIGLVMGLVVGAGLILLASSNNLWEKNTPNTPNSPNVEHVISNEIKDSVIKAVTWKNPDNPELAVNRTFELIAWLQEKYKANKAIDDKTIAHFSSLRSSNSNLAIESLSVIAENAQLYSTKPRVNLENINSEKEILIIYTEEEIHETGQPNPFLPDDLMWFSYESNYITEPLEFYIESSVKNLLPSDWEVSIPTELSIRYYGSDLDYVWGPFEVDGKNIVFIDLFSFPGEQGVFSQWYEVEPGVYELDTFIKVFRQDYLFSENISDVQEISPGIFKLETSSSQGEGGNGMPSYRELGLWDVEAKTFIEND